ncbi:MAG: DEAD/DEAH box helicase [Spirochaetaceae bacterium]|jgi:ATP-dependent RNA helicase RhlB|nr:DEAD/DEAH box helicase [Spirochaetaceae bacterium]
MEFSTLALHSDLKKSLAEAGFVSAMPVQEQVISNAFSGRDLYVQSQTGTGKTLAYLIVIMQRLISEPALAGLKALIMVPTRELAVQVEDEAKLLGKYLPFKTGAFYGGVGYGAQQQALRDDARILIGTPGRVLDLNASGYMNLMNIAFLVLDEADRMFDMGFYPDLRKLVKAVPSADRRQTMLFSATLNTYVKNLAYEYTKEPVEIEIEPEHITVNEIEQTLYHVPSNRKMSLLLGILRRENPESAIIFCNTKRYTETVARRLRTSGVRCEFISGDLPQQKRLAIIEDLKAGKIRYLVATDVAARGLDVEGLAMVVNYDLPAETENYVHRIGRTARAGKTGKAVSFASEQDVYELADIEKYLGNKIPSQVASEEMYSEEKDERAGRQRDGDRRRRGEDRPRQNEGGPRRDEARRPVSASSETRKPSGRRNRPRKERSETAGADAATVLGMPIDKRIAYYKSKYVGAMPRDGTARGDGLSQGNAGKKTGGTAKERNARRAESKRTDVRRNTADNKREAEAPKKGFFSRLVAVFAKKK